MKASERHDLKHDKYTDTVAAGMAWVSRHAARLMIIGAVILLAAAAVIWVVVSRQSAERAAQNLFTEIEEIPLDPAAPDAKTIDDLVSRCNDLVTQYPRTRAAPMALLHAAHVLTHTGRADEAAPVFKRILEIAGSRAGLVELAQRGLAESLEGSGKLQQAIVEYQLLAYDKPPASNAQTYWDIGRCHEGLSDTDQAVSFYGKVVASAPGTIWAEMARFRIDSLLSPPGPSPSSDGTPSASPAKPAAEQPEEP